MSYYCGIDLGGTTLSAGIFSESFTIAYSDSIPTRATDGELAVLNRIAELTCSLVASTETGWEGILSIGLAIPGLVKSEKGPVTAAPNVGWQNADPVFYLEKATGRPVYLFNDAACAAMAESRFGYGRQYRSFLFLTLGTAIGGAVIWNGELFSEHGLFGSELGHIPLRGDGIPCSCGLPGCFQQYGSATALARQAVEMARLHPDSILWQLCNGNKENITPQAVFHGAQAGDFTSIKIIEQFTDYLAEGIAGLVNIFRPEAVILGGGLSNAGDALLQPTQEKLFKYTHASERIGAPPVLRAELGDGAGMLGAALLAMQALEHLNQGIR